MISFENVSLSYGGHPLFSHATFCLQKGERCGIVGRNGSGKTTLFRLITGQETPDKGTISLAKNYRLGVLHQHIIFSKPTLRQEASIGLKADEQDCLYKVERILFGLGFKETDLERPPNEFSGGYALRLHLAKVLLSEPDCLLLDEPTNYLDIISIRWLERFLQQHKGELLLISHDREFLDRISTHTLGIHRQAVRKLSGNTQMFFNQIVQEEEIHERTRQNLDKKKEHLERFIERFGAKASKASQAQSKKKKLDKLPSLERLKALYHLNFEFCQASFTSDKMVEMQNISFSFTSQSSLINNFSLSIEKGQRIAIIGKNGFGKSTLMKLIANELTPSSGTRFCSEHVRIGYFGQTNIDRLDHNHTIEEEIAKANPRLTQTEVKAICGLMMFGASRFEKPIRVLSGGERSRVLLGKIIATPCNLLLLDEPTHHLDMESIEALVDAIESFSGTVILVTHSEQLLEQLSFDKLIICHQNRQSLFLGEYKEFLQQGGWIEEKPLSSVKKVNSSRQEEKTKRAEFIAARAKMLRPIEHALIKNEVLLAEKEREQQEDHQKMVTASCQGATDTLVTLSKAVASRQKEIDNLYDALEHLLQEKEKLSSRVMSDE